MQRRRFLRETGIALAAASTGVLASCARDPVLSTTPAPAMSPPPTPVARFASGIAGNLLTEDEQWRKLEVMMEVAREVWR